MTDITAAIISIFITLIIGCATLFIFHPALSQRRRKDYEDWIIREVLPLKQGKFTKELNEHHNYLLSLVIPAYNEELRLPPMLLSTIQKLNSSREEITRRCGAVLHNEKDFNTSTRLFEIVIVNDGSTDATVSAVSASMYSLQKKGVNLDYISIKLLTLPENSGKGEAVRVGMLQSNGFLRLMLDADDATNFLPSVLKLLDEMKIMTKKHIANTELIVFGSRAHLQDQSKAKRSFVRTVLMVAFHFFVETLCSKLIHDTQCGFKLFTKDAAIVLFENLHLTRWAFDTELVVMSEKLGIPIKEVGVEWHEVDGSKLATSKISLLIASVEMLRDMLCLNIMYTLRLWRLQRRDIPSN
jgi:dolichyl-phosphate beta-glucosyltransferase